MGGEMSLTIQRVDSSGRRGTSGSRTNGARPNAILSRGYAMRRRSARESKRTLGSLMIRSRSVYLLLTQSRQSSRIPSYLGTRRQTAWT